MTPERWHQLEALYHDLTHCSLIPASAPRSSIKHLPATMNCGARFNL
jgi:hypothetical protein